MNESNIVRTVFISHAKNDSELANALAKALRQRGFDVWDDKEITSGEAWSREIASALKNSDAMIALLHKHSYSSSYVRNELEHALFSESYKNRLLPVYIGSAEERDFASNPWVLKNLEHLRLPESTPLETMVLKIVQKFVALLRNGESRK